MWRPVLMAKMVRQFSLLGPVQAQTVAYIHNQTTVTTTPSKLHTAKPVTKCQIGENVSRNEKVNFLVKILYDLDDSKESVYNALDAWVAWEQDFPTGPLKQALTGLEKERQWHRIIHVIKWMLSKGQGTTMGTYGQLVRALDNDHRAEEAHDVWVKKLGVDLHSVPWQLCHQMIGVYYRNNMMERAVRLFKRLEAFDRKPRDKKVVKKVGDAYEILKLIEEKERVLEKYKSLFNETPSSKKSSTTSKKKSKG
ncbi:putative tetratricopeptide-like helical domain superfamily [Helianthus anomalus]